MHLGICEYFVGWSRGQSWKGTRAFSTWGRVKQLRLVKKSIWELTWHRARHLQSKGMDELGLGVLVSTSG